MKILLEFDVEVDGNCPDPARELIKNLSPASLIERDDFAILINNVLEVKNAPN
ncbi:hypothetical protein LCGC14_2860260 [marine sediment metagenome]|uniref:Uncharacterized protein n=1 Tax=marine sediment metagenome TaxID=412755 RepID=A0A0F8YSJ6_9ZZZZ